jgi:hypothetical protein
MPKNVKYFVGFFFTANNIDKSANYLRNAKIEVKNSAHKLQSRYFI